MPDVHITISIVGYVHTTLATLSKRTLFLSLMALLFTDAFCHI